MEWNGMEWNGWNGMEWNGMEWNGMDSLVCSPGKPVKARPYPSFFKRSLIFHKHFKVKEAVFIDL